MAMVETPRSVNRIRYPEIDMTNLSSRNSGELRSEIAVEMEPRMTRSPAVKEDMMFVAVGKDVKESGILLWALHNSRGMKICVLHVHQPAQKIPMS